MINLSLTKYNMVQHRNMDPRQNSTIQSGLMTERLVLRNMARELLTNQRGPSKSDATVDHVSTHSAPLTLAG